MGGVVTGRILPSLVLVKTKLNHLRIFRVRKRQFCRWAANFRVARHPEAILGKRDYVGLRSGQQRSNLKAKLLARRGSVNGGAGYHGFQDAHPGDLLGGDLQGVAVEDDEVGEFAGFEGAGDVVIM